MARNSAPDPGLNPFDIRATAWADDAQKAIERMRLNPFDIRATAWAAGDIPDVVAMGLNPFDIRATAWAPFFASVLLRKPS